MYLTLEQNNININAKLVKALMRVGSERPDLKWVCSMLKKHGKNAIQRMSEETGMEEFRVRSLFRTIGDMGLVQGNNLTEEGDICQQSGLAFLPEESLYLFYLPDRHFAFDDNPVIYWDYQEPTDDNMVSLNIQHKKIRNLVNNKLAKDVIWKSAGIDSVLKGSVSLRITWGAENENSLDTRVKGKITRLAKDKKGSVEFPIDNKMDLPEKVDIPSLARQWFVENQLNYDWEKKCLKVRMAELNENEKISFRKKMISLGEVSIENQKFKCEIDDIDLAAQNRKEANEWAQFLFMRKIKGYLTREEAEEELNDILALPGLKVVEADADLTTILGDIKNSKNRTSYWYCVAGEDLSLDREIRSRNTISRGERLSYADALGRLFPEIDLHNTKKILYMDRHAMELNRAQKSPKIATFVQSLRDIGYRNKMVIITKVDEKSQTDDLGKDVQLLDYGQVFKGMKYPPHSRYLVAHVGRDYYFYELTHNLHHPHSSVNGIMEWDGMAAMQTSLDDVRLDPLRNEILGMVKG